MANDESVGGSRDEASKERCENAVFLDSATSVSKIIFLQYAILVAVHTMDKIRPTDLIMIKWLCFVLVCHEK